MDLRTIQADVAQWRVGVVTFAALDTGVVTVGHNCRLRERGRIDGGRIAHFDGGGAGVAE